MQSFRGNDSSSKTSILITVCETLRVHKCLTVIAIRAELSVPSQEAPADVAFDTLGYEATLQQALAPWAPSYALVSSASSGGGCRDQG